jgi:hypothetical protein
MVIGGRAPGSRAENPTRIYFVFVRFSFMLFSEAHLVDSVIWDGRTELDSWPFKAISQIVVSSTNFTVSSETFKSFTMTRNRRGPSLVHSGTPPLVVLQLEKLEPILVLWLLSERKLAIQLIRKGCTRMLMSFCIKMLKSIRSKSLEKSSMHIRRQAPGVSIASYHLWSRCRKDVMFSMHVDKI